MVKLGIVGLGQRGAQMLKTFLAIENVDVVALCDCYQDRVENAYEVVKQERGTYATQYTDFSKFIEDERIEVVYISSSWDEHIAMAIQSMRAGKVTAMEVGGAYTVEECWELVRAYEDTKTPIMMMENCCFDQFELLATALARKGKFGEIVHCHGAYTHDLRDEVLGGRINRHYRLKNYMYRNCENYPTHELGPIAKLLHVNRGNRMVKLVSVASKACGLQAFAKTDKNQDKTLENVCFKQGDIINTLITCANGETISLKLDTTLPSYYTREFTVRGTQGFALQDFNAILLEDEVDLHESYTPAWMVEKHLNSAKKYQDSMPIFWKEMTEEKKRLGHGGMDYYMCTEFIKAVENGLDMPIDVYDAASWAAITALSEKSIALGGQAVDIPDFTNGKWLTREPKDVIKFN